MATAINKKRYLIAIVAFLFLITGVVFAPQNPQAAAAENPGSVTPAAGENPAAADSAAENAAVAENAEIENPAAAENSESVPPAAENPETENTGSANLAATAATAATPAANPAATPAAGKEYLDVNFGGTFTPQKGYTSGGDEHLGGGALTWIGKTAPNKTQDGSITLSGTTSGITYTAADSFGTTSVEKGFIAEIEYAATGNPSDLSTLFSAMGNIYVRVENNALAYGFSVQKADGKWEDHKAQMNLPANNKKHIVQIQYEPSEAAKLNVWVNGVQGPSITAEAGQKAAISQGKEKVFGIGYEVNPHSSAQNRGFAGKFYRTRIADLTQKWEFLQLNELLHVDFKGRLNNANYAGADGEIINGSLSARQPLPALQDEAAALAGDTSGFDFTPNNFHLAPQNTAGTAAEPAEQTAKVTLAMIGEARFTPSETGELQTIFAAGGNIFLRYNTQGQLELGASYQDPQGTWKTEKITAEAPANTEHVVGLAYVPAASGDSAALHLRVNGKDAQTLQLPSLAALNPTVANKVAFGNDVHPDAQNRGLKGKLSEIRFALTDSNFTASEYELIYIDQNCDTSGVQPANTIDVLPTDCEALIKTKLSALRPTEKQADYLDWGQIGFLHFNVNTFTGNSWGHGDEDPSLINAAQVDTDQWAKTFAAAGFKMLMVTVKHHDGFLLYDSRYNDRHDWPNTATAKNGGPQDLFAEIVKSAHKYGLKVGVYYSPADSYMEKQKIWGNGSQTKERTIPTLVENDDRSAKVASGELPSFKYEATDYGQYMLNQLYELLTDYGPIDEVWFDGAQGNTTSSEYYDYDAFYDLIGKLQPQALQANAAPEARWIGNEEGWARETEWNPQGVTFDQYGKITLHPSQSAADGVLGSLQSIVSGVRSGAITKLHWYPGEVDAKNGPEWFNNSNQAGPNQPKPMNEIVKFYEQSTGRNAQFLLNIPPYSDGRIPQADADIMRGYREELLRRYGQDLALGKQAFAAVSADAPDLANQLPVPHLTDGSKLSSDVAFGQTPVYTVELGASRQVDAVILGEDARNAGQQVESFSVQGRDAAGVWQDLAAGTTIGQQRNIRFAAPAQVDAVRVIVHQARGAVRLARLEVYNSESEIQDGARAYFIDPSAPTAGDGTSADTPMNSIEQLHDISLVPGSVILVKRGTQLTGDFAVFGYGTADAPIILTTYGVGAPPKVALNDVAALSLEAALTELGKDKAGWKYLDQVSQVPALRNYLPQSEMRAAGVSSENPNDGAAANLLDGRLDTIWHSQWQPNKADGPHWVVLDLGKHYDNLLSLNYLARSSGANGVAKEYKVWVSDSADSFTGEPFSGKLENVPYTQRIDLTGAAGRYLKFQIDADYANAGFGSGAELNVELLPEPVAIPDTADLPQSGTEINDDSQNPQNPDSAQSDPLASAEAGKSDGQGGRDALRLGVLSATGANLLCFSLAALLLLVCGLFLRRKTRCASADVL